MHGTLTALIDNAGSKSKRARCCGGAESAAGQENWPEHPKVDVLCIIDPAHRCHHHRSRCRTALEPVTCAEGSRFRLLTADDELSVLALVLHCPEAGNRRHRQGRTLVASSPAADSEAAMATVKLCACCDSCHVRSSCRGTGLTEQVSHASHCSTEPCRTICDSLPCPCSDFHLKVFMHLKG